MIFYCQKCGSEYPKNQTPYLCLTCGSQYIPDFNSIKLSASCFQNTDKLPYWKYSETFDLFDNAEIISLGEGNTPLIEYEISENNSIFLKMESMNPTGSYKDRNSALLISQLRARKINKIIEDSSGNAGASISAYAARVKIGAEIYVPNYASGPKLKQIRAYGADLKLIEGNRQDTTTAVLLAAKSGITYASHAFMPFGIPGIATISYELFEKLGDTIDNIIVPVGHGGLLFGIIWGFEVLLRNKFIKKLPHFIGVQVENCAPFVKAKEYQFEKIGEVQQKESIAEGILITTPSKKDMLLNYARKGVLDFVSVDEAQTKLAFEGMQSNGILVEKTSSVVIAAIRNYKEISIGKSVAIISGNGLKSI
jgi:threonine synthase